ncbi:chitinase C-terminal domain-containing protein [Rhizohabitans arisaemae]|uniref:chitinase C-terminal domain-containing protein n=1 Tax=Rhizohabitans arisaemae TaxID=2720610 RepID=UPI0024B1E0F4|nr:glycosyl hydrolase family 18 protein [Rhizohabitans arisaemae]
MASRWRASLLAVGATLSLVSGTLVAVAGAAAAVDHETCRPDGLYKSPGVAAPYCLVYDENGREKLGADHGRRIIGYFTGWRHGKTGQPAYLAPDIPWSKITHINYAFAHVGTDNRISVGANNANNPATGMEWPGKAGAEMDSAYTYKGHFNLLNKYKKLNPDVKTLVSVGGWAETGGIIGETGERSPTGGFYNMTTTSSGGVNTAAINTFADSAVQFIRTYGFNGVDIDYEYPTSMNNAGHPLDWTIANGRRAGLMKSYTVLMKTLREKLDAASVADGKYYMLTIASPSSGWLMRGMETFQVLQFLDYVNIMSYDLHGAWNEFVGPNAALYDDGKDNELIKWNYYEQQQYGKIGYLNTDWAYHYFRGAMQSGRINIGVPYYTRGWRNVQGGTNGLWGKAPSTTCNIGLTTCGDGARGIDNVWFDLENDKEVAGGGNPLWHAKNLQDGKSGSYIGAYGLTPATDPDDRLTGTYAAHYDATLKAPWLWNATKKVFLSTETTESLGAKADYVVNNGIGGIMIWELAGDYAYDSAKAEYGMGHVMTNLLYDKFRTATPYGAAVSKVAIPNEKLNVTVETSQFANGDNLYPINPKLTITNRGTTTIPAGAEFQWDYASAAPGTASDQNGWQLRVIRSEHTGPNVGGLKGDFNRVSMKLPSALPPGASATTTYVYYLPVPGPINYTVTFGGKTYGLVQDNARGAIVTEPTADPTGSCTDPAWDRNAIYTGGMKVSHNNKAWVAGWWNQNAEPGVNSVWTELGPCTGSSPTVDPTGTCVDPPWDRNAIYTAGMKVSHNNKAWRAGWWNQNNEPGVNPVWTNLGPC